MASSYDGTDLAGEAFKSVRPVGPQTIPKDIVDFQVTNRDLDMIFTNKAGNEYDVEMYN